MQPGVDSSKLCAKLVDAVAAAVHHKLIPMQDLLKMVIALETPIAGAGALMANQVARLVLELYIDQYMSGIASRSCLTARLQHCHVSP